jgi:hypothetical protein
MPTDLPGDEQVRHLREIGADRIAADVLAETHRQRRRAVRIDLGAENLGELDRLTALVRQFEGHVVLARDRLDDANRHERQRARQILRETDDLAALHARRRLDFIARDDRPRIRGNHTHLDAEVLQLLFDEPRRVFERIGGDGFLRLGRRIEQGERRQCGIARQVLEERHLLFLLGAFGARGRGRGGHDHHGFVILALLSRAHDLAFALRRGRFAELAVASSLAAQLRAGDRVENAVAELLAYGQPRETEIERQADRERDQKEQCRAREAERMRNMPRDEIADHAARRARQLHLERPHTQGLDAVARDEHEHERERFGKPGAVARRVFIDNGRLRDAPVIRDDAPREQHDQPVGRQPEDEQQDIGRVGADAPRPVPDVIDAHRVSPARILAAVRKERHHEKQSERDLEDPANFGEEP